MKSTILFGAIVASFLYTYAAESLTPEQIKERQQKRYQKTGGYILNVGASRGKVAFVDTQTILSADDIKLAMREILEDTKYNFVYERASQPLGELGELKESSHADLAIIIVNDPKLPTSLVAPDDRWGMINIAKMDKRLMTPKAKQTFFAGRCRREILRIFALLAGGGASSFVNNITCQNELCDLDKVDEFIPADVKGRNYKYLDAIGFKQATFSTYKKACQEGWAPAPTNAIQKAIWDKVHQLPTKPIAIKPESKPVKD